MNFDDLDALLASGIADRAFPGAAYCVGDLANRWVGCAGTYNFDSDIPPISNRTIFDLASVTKVVATTALAMKMVGDTMLNLDEPVAKTLPAFGASGKHVITPRDLLTHRSGLIPHRRYDELCKNRAAAWDMILAEEPITPPGTAMAYSCVGFLALMEQLCTILVGPEVSAENGLGNNGGALDWFLKEDIWIPLGMDHTDYRPSRYPERIAMCAPTEGVQGVVHDENCRFLGGVTGNAGVFGVAEELGRFAQEMLRTLAGRGTIWAQDVAQEFIRKSSDLSTRALGWDTKSPEGSSAGARFGGRSFGHTGFTGTSIWIDPDAEIFAVLLTNRVNPTRENQKIEAFRPEFHDLAFDLLGRF